MNCRFEPFGEKAQKKVQASEFASAPAGKQKVSIQFYPAQLPNDAGAERVPVK
jgi:hypothetical protein